MMAAEEQARQGRSSRLVNVLLNQQAVMQLRNRGP